MRLSGPDAAGLLARTTIPGKRQVPLAQIRHFDELAGRADFFGRRIAHRRPQLIGAGLLHRMIERVDEPVLERALYVSPRIRMVYVLAV